MAIPFETWDVVLTKQQADHINQRHVNFIKHPRTSKFFLTFNLSATLGLLSRRTWERRVDVELIEQGWRQGHGQYYLYTFAVKKIIGQDPHGFPAKHIAIYYAQKIESLKFEIITAYLYTASYNAYFLSRRPLRFFYLKSHHKTTALLGATNLIKVLTNLL